MSALLDEIMAQGTFGSATLRPRFDAERDTPALVDAAASQCPALRAIMSSLRRAIPLMPHSRVGPCGPFIRFPNHYRSVSWLLTGNGHATQPSEGAIVFKGTEPVLPDFAEYLDWMLQTPYRSSYLPLGMFFPLHMKLPPAAMWIEECLLEQDIASTIQQDYLVRYGRLARLPLPLFVYELTSEQVQHYETVVRTRLPPSIFKRIKAKVRDGLGVEVYYYPSPPLRVADVSATEYRQSFRAASSPEAVEATCNEWITLMAELLQLGYMPYAPWNYGMGSCVDSGNACIDGGFNDLLTIVAFDSIPGEHLFARSLSESIEMMAASIATLSALAAGTGPPPQTRVLDVAVSYVTERLRTCIKADCGGSQPVDPRLLRSFETPSARDVLHHLREARDVRGNGAPAQFRPRQPATTAPAAIT